MKKKLTFAEAKLFPSRNKKLTNNCGLCQLFIPTEDDNCGNCPLTDDGNVCCSEFFRWGSRRSTETAQAVLDRIKAIEV